MSISSIHRIVQSPETPGLSGFRGVDKLRRATSRLHASSKEEARFHYAAKCILATLINEDFDDKRVRSVPGMQRRMKSYHSMQTSAHSLLQQKQQRLQEMACDISAYLEQRRAPPHLRMQIESAVGFLQIPDLRGEVGARRDDESLPTKASMCRPNISRSHDRARRAMQARASLVSPTDLSIPKTVIKTSPMLDLENK